ncbi:helix-turn-helix domain-containing protein [Candidatus Palauibacter sp.]|uniref:helix-turn-helix domain-containing protein n=1 Tax=Candidatus Palauibacter sp. TaxID=3101350 RepID=UPI003AF26042
MAERDIAAEVLEGLREVRDHRAGKLTLRTTRVPRPLPRLSPETIRGIRDELNVSRGVFAGLLRVPVRTLEGWEQGRSSPPHAAAALMLMARKYPDTVDRLATL